MINLSQAFGPAPLPRRTSVAERFRTDRWAMVGAGWLVVMILLAVVGPMLAGPVPTFSLTAIGANHPPSWQYPLGTNGVGASYVNLLLDGIRPTMVVTALAASLSLSLGVLVGVAAGLSRGLMGELIARAIDLVFSIPGFLIMILLLLQFGQGSLAQALAIALVSWPSVARVVRVVALTLRESDRLALAKMAGGGWAHLLWRHLLPNLVPTLLVFFAFQLGTMMQLEMLIGLTSAGTSTLTGLIVLGMRNLLADQWQMVEPALVFTFTIVATVWVGEGLTHAWDARLPRF